MSNLMVYGVCDDGDRTVDVYGTVDFDDLSKEKEQESGPPLQLREILWEVTNKCNKNCDYCGSKDVMGACEPLSDDDTLNIAREIAKSGVNQVVLTGGEPGCLNDELFINIIKLLKHAMIDVKIVTNGLALEKNISQDIKTYGLSINTLEDIETCEHELELADKITIITNFGTHNIWNIEKIYEFAIDYPIWQVQLTMGEYQLPADGIKLLREKLEGYSNDGDCIIVFADNLQRYHTCSAGLRSCSVTWDGNIVACLSERSYNNDNMKIYGNILKKPLTEIWREGFQDIRFECGRKCCRDYIDYPIDSTSKVDNEFIPSDTQWVPMIPPDIKHDLIVAMYGVISSSEIPKVMSKKQWKIE
jgi:MoaA/NifB/PqqE/SkfB family radical SAM enzyme